MVRKKKAEAESQVFDLRFETVRVSGHVVSGHVNDVPVDIDEWLLAMQRAGHLDVLRSVMAEIARKQGWT